MDITLLLYRRMSVLWTYVLLCLTVNRLKFFAELFEVSCLIEACSVLHAFERELIYLFSKIDFFADFVFVKSIYKLLQLTVPKIDTYLINTVFKHRLYVLGIFLRVRGF
jgi:hypothetical protein